MSHQWGEQLCVAVGRATQIAFEWTGIPARFGHLAKPANHDENRVRGMVALASIPLFALHPVLGFVAIATGWNAPRLLARREQRRADIETAAQLGLTIELLAVSAHTGSTVPRAIEVVGSRVPGRVGRTLRQAAARLSASERVDETLEWLGTELGTPSAPMVGVLRSAYLDGEPLTPALEGLAQRMAEDRRRQVEAEARQLSVRLLIPLVCCLLPAFALIAVVPVLLDSLRVLAQ